MLTPGTIPQIVLSLADFFAKAINTLLGINYVIASAILSVVEQTALGLYNLFLFLSSALEDFESFLVEVASCLGAVFESLVAIVCSVYFFFCASFVLLEKTLSSLVGTVFVALDKICLLVKLTYDTLQYLARVFGGALLVLLQFFPNTIVGTVQFVVDCVSRLLRTAQSSFFCGKEGSVRFFSSAAKDIRTAFLNIPTDAYVGVAMISAFYFLCTRTPVGSYVSPRKLVRLSRQLLRSVTREGRRLVRRRIPDAGIRLTRFLHEGFALCQTRVRCWFSGDVDWQEEEPEEVAENNSSGPSQQSTEKSVGAMENLKRELELEKERNMCIICQEEPKSVILLPCRHMCLCRDCCSELLNRRSTCPLCRTAILSPIQVFT